MTTVDSIEQQALDHAARLWETPAAELYAQELTAAYPWLKTHAVFRVQTRSRRAMLVAVGPEGACLAFPFEAGGPHDADNRAAFTALVQRDGMTLPDDVEPTTLASAVRQFLRGPRGFVGSPDFLDAQRSALYLWVPPGLEDGQRLFESHCQTPVLDRDDGTWTLTFSYFTGQGGVERWTVRGDARGIVDADAVAAVPNGTFDFPYFGAG